MFVSTLWHYKVWVIFYSTVPFTSSGFGAFASLLFFDFWGQICCTFVKNVSTYKSNPLKKGSDWVITGFLYLGRFGLWPALLHIFLQLLHILFRSVQHHKVVFFEWIPALKEKETHQEHWSMGIYFDFMFFFSKLSSIEKDKSCLCLSSWDVKTVTIWHFHKFICSNNVKKITHMNI